MTLHHRRVLVTCLCGAVSLCVLLFLLPVLWKGLALNLLIRRLEGEWKYEDTMKAYWIGYTADMRAIQAHGEDAIEPLLRFIRETRSDRAREGAIHALHLIGIEGEVVGRMTEAFKSRKARDALISLLPTEESQLLVLSLLIRDPWPTDVPHLFRELEARTPHSWALVKALQRYAIHDRPVHQDLPAGADLEIRWEQSVKVPPGFRRDLQQLQDDRSRHRRLQLRASSLEALTECDYCGFGDELDYILEGSTVTICSIRTARRRWLDWYRGQTKPLRMGRSRDLLFASAYGGVDRLRQRFAANPAAVSFDEQGSTALHWAAEGGHGDVVKLLLELGASSSTRTHHQQESPLDLALQKGHAAVVAALVPGSAAGLLLAVTAGDHARCEGMLLRGEVDANHRDGQGYTPLHYAARFGTLDIAELLLKHGADGEAVGQDGVTPLHEAAKYGRESIVDLLIRRGARVDSRTRARETPLLLAVRQHQPATAIRLLDAGANVDARDESGRTPLHWAALRGNTEILALLHERNASLDARDSLGRTALQAAAGFDWGVEVVKLLLELGATVDAAAEDGGTALHEAAGLGRDATVRRLLERGARIDVETKHGETPLLLASLGGHEEVVRQLRKAGAPVEPLQQPRREGRDGSIVLTTGEECIELELREERYAEPADRNPLLRTGLLHAGERWQLPNEGYLLYRLRPCGGADWGYWKHQSLHRTDRDYSIRLSLDPAQ